MVTAQQESPISGLVRWLQIPNARAEVSFDNIVMALGAIVLPVGLARLFADGPIGNLNIAGPLAATTTGPVPFLLAGFVSLAIAAGFLFVPALAQFRAAALGGAGAGAFMLAESVSRIGDTPKGGFAIVLLTFLSLGLFVFPKTRNLFFLGATLYSMWLLLVVLVSDNETPFMLTNAVFPGVFFSSSVTSGVSLGFAVVCLIAVWFLDFSNAQGLAAPFAAVGIVAAGSGVGQGPNAGVSILAFALGAAALWVGAWGGRRGTAWAGAVGMFVSLARLYSSFDNRAGGLVIVVLALILLAIAGRNLIPGVAKAMNGIAANNAVMPGGAQPAFPGQQFPQGNGGQDFNNPNPGAGFGQPVGGVGNQNPGAGFGQQQADGIADPANQAAFNQPASGFPQADPNNAAGAPGQFGAAQEFQAPGQASEQAQFQPGAFGGAEQIDTPTAAAYPSQEAAAPGTQAGDGEIKEANWYADPTERYDHRWHDGVNWTEHVATAGNSAVDPIN